MFRKILSAVLLLTVLVSVCTVTASAADCFGKESAVKTYVDSDPVTPLESTELYGMTYASVKSFAVIMGTYYGRAKVAESYGHFDEAKSFRITGYVLASILHGLYDTCAMLNTNLSMICFILIVICVYLLIYRVTRIQAAGDKPVAGETVDMTFNPFEDVENVDAVEVSSETHKPHPLQDLMDKYD